MTEWDIRLRRGRHTYRAACLTGAAALAIGLVSGCSSSGDDSSSTRTNTTQANPLGPSVPDHISIPDINVDAGLGTVGLDNNGKMETPPFDQPMQADWYKQGPTPGEKGAAAIAGHMDTPNAPKAVFYHLKELKRNAEVDIHRADGTIAVFKVDHVDTFKKDQFPTDRVYGETERAELRLITCGGDLTQSRHWNSNVIVFAHLTGEKKA